MIKRFRRKKAKKQVEQVTSPTEVPRITTETIAENREEVLGRARKYIYPLQHSKQRILKASITLLVVGLVTFFIYCALSLYKFNGTSTFLYRVSQVIPFPIAKAGSQYVAYENYLFELRHYMHYYESQQRLDFKSEEGQQQLEAFRKQALDKVVDDSFVKKLADKYKIAVSEREVDDQIAVVRSQNRLGSSDQVFEDVLKDYWGWTVNDFRRSLKSQMLAQKVIAVVDTQTSQKANSALEELNAGKSFADVAKIYSDDAATKPNGGDLGVVSKTNRDLTAETVAELYKLKPGEYSGIINVGYSLEILKNIETKADGQVHGAHILFNFKDISGYINDMKNQQKVKTYVKHS